MEKRSDSHTNSGDILVPSVACGAQNETDSGEQAFWEGTL
jgi:hypothetical protein